MDQPAQDHDETKPEQAPTQLFIRGNLHASSAAGPQGSEGTSEMDGTAGMARHGRRVGACCTVLRHSKNSPVKVMPGRRPILHAA